MADENQAGTEAGAQTETQLPDNATIDEAVALMGALDDAAGGQQAAEAQAQSDQEATQDAGEDQEQQEQQEQQQEQATTETGAPEFWSAEDKTAWAQVPEALRPVLAKYEQQRIAFANGKAEEAAAKVREAQTQAQQAAATVDAAAQWWKQNGPGFVEAFGNKWSQVDFNRLSEENPAEWARLTQQRDREAALLREAHERGQAHIRAQQQRAEEAFRASRRASHETIAREEPSMFGTPEAASKSYAALGEYLHSQGVPIPQINAIHEAPVLRLAIKAWKYDTAQKQASAAVQRDSGGKFTASKTPTRVQPGPAPQRTGNQGSERARQVGERFRASGGASIDDAAELIRLAGL